MPETLYRSALHFSDRTQECTLFRNILRRESLLRGLVMHSDGKAGVGKSTLLKMFEDECSVSDLPMPTTALHFNAERLDNWQKILNDTVEAIGSEHFQEYIQLRKIYGSRSRLRERSTESSSISVYHEVHFHETVSGPLHAGSGDIEMGKAATISRDRPPVGSDSPEARLSSEEAREYLTRVFLESLNNIPDPLQVVWLVDVIGKLDNVTKSWLIRMFWEIAEGTTERLVLVVAGRDRLRYEPHWAERVGEMLVRPFNEDIIVEILLEIWPNYDVVPLRIAARGLIERSDGGKPLAVITEIERQIGRERGSYV